MFICGILVTGCEKHPDVEKINRKNQEFSIIVYLDIKANDTEIKRVRSLISNVSGTYPVSGISFQERKNNDALILRANCKGSKNDEQSALNYLTSMLESDGLLSLVDVIVVSKNRP
jgi:hypothetical protein